ncbi:unnamed protein product [Boreogadus saida]
MALHEDGYLSPPHRAPPPSPAPNKHITSTLGGRSCNHAAASPPPVYPRSRASEGPSAQGSGRPGALVAAMVGESGGSALVIMEGRGRLGCAERPSEGDGPGPSREGSPAMGGTNQVHAHVGRAPIAEAPNPLPIVRVCPLPRRARRQGTPTMHQGPPGSAPPCPPPHRPNT